MCDLGCEDADIETRKLKLPHGLRCPARPKTSKVYEEIAHGGKSGRNIRWLFAAMSYGGTPARVPEQFVFRLFHESATNRRTIH
jgi:hypothetical protein